MGFLPCITSLEREKGRRGFLHRRKYMTIHSNTSKQADSPNVAMSHKFAKTGRYVSIHQFGEDMRQQKRTLIIVLLHQFNAGIYTSPCSTRCDIVCEDSFLKTLLLKGRNDGRSNEAQQC